jgi:putative ABC transport system substrate-binding protein
MRRREFITLLGGAAAWPIAARAQQPALPVIGYLSGNSPEGVAHLVTAFRNGLSETGYVEGRNVAIEYRWANNDLNRLPALAADLVRRRVAVIVAGVTSALPAKAATTTIPIVFVAGGDPVELGLITSLSRPGGNLTGVTGMSGELAGKQLGLLHEMVPRGVRFAALVNPTNPAAISIAADVKKAASTVGVQLEILMAATNGDIDMAFASLAQRPVAALLVSSDPLFINRRLQLAMLAVKHAVLALFPFRENAEAGGLMSYGPSTADVNRQAGIYTGRILKGENPANLPVMQASKFEFVINLLTARVMGIDIPASLLARADEVIE